MADEDWKKSIDAAAAAGRKKADAAIGDKLNQIQGQAAQLRKIFDHLKQKDKATYDQLIRIVEEATKKNESTAVVIGRLRDLGVLVEQISSATTLVGLRQALNLPVGQ